MVRRRCLILAAACDVGCCTPRTLAAAGGEQFCSYRKRAHASANLHG